MMSNCLGHAEPGQEKFYVAFGDHNVRILTADGVRALPLRLDLSNHSPTGFSWGYGGSGPAQLALALLADALKDDERALRLHQPFKWQVTAMIKRPCWVLSVGEVREVAIDLENLDQTLCTQG